MPQRWRLAPRRRSRGADRARNPLDAQGEIEARHFDPRDLVAGDRSTFCMGIGEGVAEALAACIGMALNKYLFRA